jgi:hypothetical protein
MLNSARQVSIFLLVASCVPNVNEFVQFSASPVFFNVKNSVADDSRTRIGPVFKNNAGRFVKVTWFRRNADSMLIIGFFRCFYNCEKLELFNVLR